MDYIKRESAKRIVDDINTWSSGWRDYAKLQMDSLPAADVREVKMGKWIWDDEGYHCSECFYHAYGEAGEILSGNWQYCPNCGASMEVEHG